MKNKSNDRNKDSNKHRRKDTREEYIKKVKRIKQQIN
jgi:hypothetical protein